MILDIFELEEHVGKFWDRIVTRAAQTSYPDAAVYLSDINKTLSIIFRAMGGDKGLSVQTTTATEHHARRGLLQRIAGSQAKSELGWLDDHALRLPEKIDCFADRALNRKLYIWLAALAATDDGKPGPWYIRNQQQTIKALHRFPGLKADYDKLVEAQLALRPDINRLSQEAAAQETAIQQALKCPGQNEQFPIAKHPPQPVLMWMHPSPPITGTSSAARDIDPDENNPQSSQQQQQDKRKRSAQREENDEKEAGLLAVRYENLFSWGEFINLNRSSEDDEDLDQASAAADDMETLHLTQDNKNVASKLKFDLDLPSEHQDDLPLGSGILLAEWDYKKQIMKPDYCSLQEMLARDFEPCELPQHLKKTARKLKAQFEAIQPTPIWLRAQQDGSEIDLDAYLTFTTNRASGHGEMTGNLYKDLRAAQRDLSCLLLADLSMSTDAWVSNSARIIDVIRDSLYLFAESLTITGDRFAIHGFSSRNRNHIRFNLIKSFEDKYNARCRGLIQAIKPGFYTRMGTAIRHASNLLEKQPSSQKLLLILTDGKPNDLDVYEGRYGIEDTRMAIIEARQKGLQPFCVTIDEKAGNYLPHIFGAGAYVVIRKAEELPRELPLLYARLTQQVH
ncbi:MAG: VWA domain-containing protein [Gammaproteobacteria bacterium]|nr:VWA domain-containing protein [Gammaproteobacteria bacterium]